MSKKHNPEALVLGAGPVGLIAAAELKNRGIDVQIIDKDWRGSGFSYALGLHPGSVDLLDGLGLAESMVPLGYRVERMVFYEGPAPAAELNLSALDARHPWLTILPQNWIESALETWLGTHKVKVQWKHHVWHIDGLTRPVDLKVEQWSEDSTGYAAARRQHTVDKVHDYHAQFVIGADGHESTVRRSLNAEYDPVGPPELFGVFEFETDHDAGHAARIILNENDASILWPLPGGRCRWSFQLSDPEEFTGPRIKSRLPEAGRWITEGLDEGRLKSLISERAPWFKGDIQKLIWSIPIRFERRMTSSWGRGGGWLIGDAAHTGHPAGLHSMNVGFREARDLAEGIRRILREDAPPSVLEEYAAEREAEWRQLFNIGKTLQVTDKASPFVGKNAERILSCATASGPHLVALLEQVGLQLEPAKTG